MLIYLQLYEAIGRPLDRIPSILVGGTNGKVFRNFVAFIHSQSPSSVIKGTTSLKIARCLQVSGMRTGLFVSPHISSFRERIQVDGELIEESDVEVYD
jgi:dihydrofolate synthase/folylpolyglutamate synthase